MRICKALYLVILAVFFQSSVYAEEPADVVRAAQRAGHFTIFLKALETSGLTSSLENAGPFTLFAPTDDAFKKIPDAQVEQLFGDKEKLKEVIEYHIVPGKVTFEEAKKLPSAKTLQGDTVTIDTKSEMKVNGVKIVGEEILAGNGVVHAIDTVLQPLARK